MAKRWKHWVRVVSDYSETDAEAKANAIIDAEDFDVVVPRIASAGLDVALYTTILLCFRKQVEVDAGH